MEVLKLGFVLYILLHLVTTLLADTARHILQEYPCDHYNDVIHVWAQGSKDTIHYVYSSHGLPSLLIARTDLNNTLRVDCVQFHNGSAGNQSGSINYSHRPNDVMVLLFNRLIEYIDKDKTANLNDYKQPNSTWFASYHLAAASWEHLSYDNVSQTVTFTANNNSDTVLPFLTNGSLSLRFRMFADEGYGSEPPHLGYNENMTHIDVVLDHLKAHDSQSRFAVELVLVTSKKLGGDISMSKHYTLDDEHSPGSFQSVDWVVKSANHFGAFVSWKPICYTAAVRKVSTSQRINYYDLQPHHTFHSINSSGLAFAYFGVLDNRTHVRANNISFGGSKDKMYYNVTQYTAWTFSAGLGAPIDDSYSLLLIIIVAVLLGVPLLLIVVGGIFIAVRRSCHRRRDGYMWISSSYAEIN